MGGSDVIGMMGEGEGEGEGASGTESQDGDDGHEGGAPLSCWVERSKPRYKGPSSLIFYYVFWYWFEGHEDSFRQVQTRLQVGKLSLQIDWEHATHVKVSQSVSNLGGGESEPTYTLGPWGLGRTSWTDVGHIAGHDITHVYGYFYGGSIGRQSALLHCRGRTSHR